MARSAEVLKSKWAWNAFSAVGYYFARDIRKSAGVPIGLIGAYKGVTSAQSWTSVAGLQQETLLAHYVLEHENIVAHFDAAQAAYPTLKAKAEAQWKIQLGKWEKDKADGKGEVPRPVFHAPTSPDGGFHTPGNLFNAMISPMLRFGIRGVLWYQGESNANTMAAAKVYSTLFLKMIQDWRAHWGQGDFLFLFVQLASFKAHPQGAVEDAPWPVLREAQAGALALTNTGMDTAVDMGDANNIHPAHKSSVGKRLTLASRHVVYVENLAWSGPVFQSMEIRADKVRIHFKAQPGNGLVIGVPPWIPGGGAPEKPTTLKGVCRGGSGREICRSPG